MREIKYIVIHCTATHPRARVDSITTYWRDQLGWANPGYHYLIDHMGKIHNLHPHDKPANGVRGHNKNSIHVSYIGGINERNEPTDTRTIAQLAAMELVIRELKEAYPEAEVLGHRDFPNVRKACPSFDVKQWLKSIGI